MSIDLNSEVLDSYLRSFTTKYDADVFWVFISGLLVFIMHLGFAMLETGLMSDKHKVNILFKNFVTVIIGSLAYFITGFGFAYGSGKNNSFLGGDSFFGTDFQQKLGTGETVRIEYFQQFAFAITAATIISGAVVGRMRLEAYFLIVFVMTGLVVPAVAHWAWSDSGVFSAFKGGEIGDLNKYFLNKQYRNACGVIDFAGSGVIHLTGGTAALIGSYFVGPRTGRFKDDGTVAPMPGHNLAISTFGTILLWVGWFGFNTGSTLSFDGVNAARIAVTTVLSPAASFVTFIILQKIRTGKYDLPGSLNAVLSGLVAISAGCSTVADYAAIPIGCIAALLYAISSHFLLTRGIDDPIGAVPVHFVNGIWGVIAVTIFGIPPNHTSAYNCPIPLTNSTNIEKLFEPLPGFQALQQILLIFVIIAWTSTILIPLFFVLRKWKLLRVSITDEEIGLDKVEHGVQDFFETGLNIQTPKKQTGTKRSSNAGSNEVHFIPNL